MPPLRTIVLDDHEIDVAGVCAVLGRYGDRIRVVDHSDPDVDVVLYGARERHEGHDAVLHALLRSSPATVVVFGWGPDSPHAAWALTCGAHGQLSKTMSGDELVSGLERIHQMRNDRGELPADTECHPLLRAVGLTPRELEVLTLIAQGMTNQEIADCAFLSINSVKTYVRTAYRKIGVTRRSQAVNWGIRIGLTPVREPELAL